MFQAENLSNLLHALASGHPDRVRNLVLTSEELDESERETLSSIVYDDSLSPGDVARRIGDHIRESGGDQALVNECYRLAFYVSEGPVELTDNPLYSYFLAHRSGRLLDKWIHYFDIYHRHLERFRGTAPTVLEIGVSRGGSLDMWGRYFGAGAVLVGVDIDPMAAQLAAPSHTVVIGDQADPDFLSALAKQRGPFDIVIDDGGHTMEQQIVSAEVLFPHVRDGGTYLVEDCHTSYWDDFGGGRKRSGTFMEWTKDRLDDLNGYHQPEPVHPMWTDHVHGVHCYDSVVVLEKLARHAPFNEQMGAAEFVFFQRPTSALVGEMLATRDAALAQVADLRGACGDELRLVRNEMAQLVPRARELEGEVERLEAELTVTRNDLLEAWEQSRAMRKTLSWRVTAPLRAVRRRQRGAP